MNNRKKYTSTNGTSQSKGKTDWVGGHFEKAKAALAATLSVKNMSCRSFTNPGASHNVHDLSQHNERALQVHILRCTTFANSTQGLEARLSSVALPVKAITYINYKKASCKVFYNCMSGQ